MTPLRAIVAIGVHHTMKVLIVSRDDVKRLLSMKECIDTIEEMFRTLARGDAVLPLRQVVWQPDRKGAMVSMPSYLGSPSALGAKVISFFGDNTNTKFDTHQGVVLLFEPEHGQLLGLMDAASITSIRTAAASGVATRLLSRRSSSKLAILGSGTEAATHLEAMLVVRPISEVRVWSRNPAHAIRFVDHFSSIYTSIKINAPGSVREATSDADIICTTTSTIEPILAGEWIKNGSHINAVGSSTPNARELDSQAIAKSSLFVDRRESTLHEAGDFLIPKKEGVINNAHVKGEIGDVLLKSIRGRVSEEEITLFKSLGIATEDVAAAHLIYERASKTNSGTWVELGGERAIF